MSIVEKLVTDSLREDFPYGHPKFIPTTVRELQLHSDKNHDYAAGGSPLGNFERVSAILSMYPNLDLGDERVVALVYMMKQVDAVMWSLNQGHTAKVEGLSSRLQDISVYAKIVQCMEQDRAEEAGVAMGVPSAPEPTPFIWTDRVEVDEPGLHEPVEVV